MTIVTASQLTNCSNVNVFEDLILCSNQSGGGYTFVAINFLVFAVLFVTLSVGFGWEIALLGAGFVGLVLALMFSYMGVMSWAFTSMYVGALIVMIFYIIWSNKYD